MDGVSRQALAAAIAVIGIFAGLNSAFAAEEATATPSAAEQIRVEDPIYVVAQRANRTSRGATVLPLSLIETPQSVTIIDRDFIDDFGLNDVNHVLDLTTGVNVEEVESDRTYYNSRGFDIKSMQTDGVGMPFILGVFGPPDPVAVAAPDRTIAVIEVTGNHRTRTPTILTAAGVAVGTRVDDATAAVVRQRLLNTQLFSRVDVDVVLLLAPPPPARESRSRSTSTSGGRCCRCRSAAPATGPGRPAWS